MKKSYNLSLLLVLILFTSCKKEIEPSPLSPHERFIGTWQLKYIETFDSAVSIDFDTIEPAIFETYINCQEYFLVDAFASTEVMYYYKLEDNQFFKGNVPNPTTNGSYFSISATNLTKDIVSGDSVLRYYYIKL
jgi:hypothetical protein